MEPVGGQRFRQQCHAQRKRRTWRNWFYWYEHAVKGRGKMDYVTLREASNRTDVSVSTLRNYIASGRLNAARRGVKILVVRTADLDALFTPHD